MEKIDLTQPHRARLIYRRGNDRPIKDKVIYIIDGFLVTQDSLEAEESTLYSLKNIYKLVDVVKITEGG